jgi:tetratricopeptide (TPR) repeat protein
MFTDAYDGNYFPLTLLSYAADYALAGAAPAWVRLQSVCWHAGTVVLLALLLLQLVPRLTPWLAALFALYFGLHPLRYESVIWLSERKDVLCAFFFLLAFFLHVRSSQLTPREYVRRALPWVALAFLLALLSKSMAVTLPPVILAHDWFLARDRMRGRVPAYALLLALAIGFSALTRVTQRGARSQPGSLPFVSPLAACVTYAPLYLVQKTVLPVALSPLHPMSDAPGWLSARHVGGLVTSLALIAGILLLRTRAPAAAFGLAWFLIVLAPVSGIIPVGHAYVADRYSYLPSVGLVLALAVLADRLPARVRWLPLAGLAALLLAANPMAAITTWSSSTALWGRVLESYPDCAPAKIGLGHALYSAGDRRAARVLLENTPDVLKDGIKADILYRDALAGGDFTRAAAILAECPNPHIRLGGELKLHLQQKQFPEAVAAAQRLLQEPRRTSTDAGLAANALLLAGLEPDAEAVLRGMERPSIAAAAAQGQLANLKLEGGDLAGAQYWADLAALTDPAQYDTARATLLLLCARHQFSAAGRRAEKILRRPEVTLPTRQLVWGILGYAESMRGRWPAALAACQEAIRLGNLDPRVRHNADAAAKALGVVPNLPPVAK